MSGEGMGAAGMKSCLIGWLVGLFSNDSIKEKQAYDVCVLSYTWQYQLSLFHARLSSPKIPWVGGLRLNCCFSPSMTSRGRTMAAADVAGLPDAPTVFCKTLKRPRRTSLPRLISLQNHRQLHRPLPTASTPPLRLPNPLIAASPPFYFYFYFYDA